MQSNDFCKNIIYDFLVRYSKEVHIIPNHWDYTYRKLYGAHMTSLSCHSWNWCDMYITTIVMIFLCCSFRTSLISLRDLQFLKSSWSSSQNIGPLWRFSAIANGSRNVTFLPVLSACHCIILENEISQLIRYVCIYKYRPLHIRYEFGCDTYMH